MAKGTWSLATKDDPIFTGRVKVSSGDKPKTTLLEQKLMEVEARLGKGSHMAQHLRDQIHAQATGKSAQEIYVTGSTQLSSKFEKSMNK